MKVEGREGALMDLKEKISLEEAEKNRRHADIRKSSDSKADNCGTNSKEKSKEKSKDSDIENISKEAEGRDNSEGKNNKSSGKKKSHKS